MPTKSIARHNYEVVYRAMRKHEAVIPFNLGGINGSLSFEYRDIPTFDREKFSRLSPILIRAEHELRWDEEAEDQPNIHTLCYKYDIWVKLEYANKNPNLAISDKWADSATHFKCTLTINSRDHRVMTTYFSQGSAIHDDPDSADILDSLLSDASCADESFEDFCGNFGYSTDSRTAFKLYRTIQHQTTRLQAFLGDLYDTFYQAERL